MEQHPTRADSEVNGFSVLPRSLFPSNYSIAIIYSNGQTSQSIVSLPRFCDKYGFPFCLGWSRSVCKARREPFDWFDRPRGTKSARRKSPFQLENSKELQTGMCAPSRSNVNRDASNLMSRPRESRRCYRVVVG